jgi:hypothetical protein
MDEMNVQDAVRSQYLAALKMLREAVTKCPAEMWDASWDQDRTWFKAQHALYWTQRYLRTTDKRFVPGELHGKPKPGAPMAKASVLEYLRSIEGQVADNFAAPSRKATRGGGSPGLNRLELHLINIRHLQQHAGELYERLGARAHIRLHWTEEVHGKRK